jgi:integrase
VVRRHQRLKAPKTSQARTLTLDERAVAALAEQRERQRADAARLGPTHHNGWNLVFTADSGVPLTPDVVSRWFREAAEAAGVRSIRLHDLRHTHATLMLAAGVPVKVVSQRLGHASVQLTLDVYAHVLPAMDADAVQRFTDFVWESRDP